VKPTSIVFLVIAALMIIGGVITCSVAEDIALTDNYTLFPEETDGTHMRYPFSAEDINKIELLLSDATVNIIGDSAETCIEFLNFREGLYTFSTVGKVITFDESPDLESIFNAKGGLSFSGIRNILRSKKNGDQEKIVNIHLTPTAAMKVISIKANNCNVQADRIHTKFDLQISAEISAALDASDFRTGCGLTVSGGKLDMNLNNATVNSISTEMRHAEIDADLVDFHQLTLNLSSGSVHIRTVTPLDRDGRIREVARIIGGANITQITLKSAEEMLNN